MSYRSDHAVLHAVPRREPRFSLRVKLVLAAVFCVAVGGSSAIAAYQFRESEPTDEEKARVEVVLQYLAANHANAPWYGSILDVSIKDNRLYVWTNEEYLNFSADVSKDEKARQLDLSYARQIYQVLWDWHFVVPELEFYYVIIQDQDGNYIDGGQG